MQGKRLMNAILEQPHIYHITHVDNLEAIIKDGGLYSNAAMIKKGRSLTILVLVILNIGGSHCL